MLESLTCSSTTMILLLDSFFFVWFWFTEAVWFNVTTRRTGLQANWKFRCAFPVIFVPCPFPILEYPAQYILWKKKMNFFTSYGCRKQELNYFNIIGFMCADSWGRIIWASVASCLIRKFKALVVWHFWQAQRSIALLSIGAKCITNHGKPVWFGLYCFLALILLFWFEAYTSQNEILLDFVFWILRTYMLAT